MTEHFINEGLPIKYLSPINEPIWVWTGGQEGCHYMPYQCATVMKYFAHEMNKRRTLDEVKLSGLENGDIRYFNKSYTRNLLKHREVRERIDSIDIHSYCTFVPVPFFNNRVAFVKRYRKWFDRHYPDVPVKMSEWCHMQRKRNTGMDSALETAKIIYEDISLLNVTSWQHWIACALDEYDYCDGLIYINPDSETFEVTKRYYVTGNFSKFIPYGAYRFEVKCDDEDIQALGFKDENKKILILINPTVKEKSFTPEHCPAVYVTDKNQNLQHTEYQCGEIITITPHSVTTVVLTED